MAMFDLEDSEDVKISRCKTDAETLVKGKGLPGLKVEDCEVGHSSVTPQKMGFKVLKWIMGIVAGVLVVVIAKGLGFG